MMTSHPLPRVAPWISTAMLIIAVVTSIVTTLVASTAAEAQERLPPIPAEKLTDAQKKAVADYKAIRGDDLATPPWSVLLRVPDQVVPALQIRLHYRDHSSLSPRLTEFAIMFAARRWTNNWEWNAHLPSATTAGVTPEILAALTQGRRPDRMAEDETTVYDFCTELQSNKSVSDPTYARALAAFGEAGVVELASIQGYYTYLAMVMNAARVGVQANTTPALERFPR